MKEVDGFPLISWHARPDMSCEYVSPGWLDFTGTTPEYALNGGWSRAVHPEDLARWLDACVRAFDERRSFEIEYRLRCGDGTYRWVLERAAPRYTAEGAFIGFGGVCFDIEEHRRAEHGLARALERERRLRVATEEASRMRHGLTLSVLQDLRPPAQAIATWAGHLREQVPKASDTAQALGEIERSAREQSRIIASLLDLSGNQADRPLLTGVRVLVVEQDGAARDALAKVLGIAGADVRAAASTEQALQTAQAWPPDVVLSADANYSFIRALRSLPAERGGCLRAAALTATEPAAAVAAGYDAQLAKPVEPVALLATVARLAQPVGT